MSQNLSYRRAALAPILALAATALALTGCAPDASQTAASDNTAAPSAGPNAAAAAHAGLTAASAAPTPPPAPVACPKLAAPQCPSAPPARLAEAAPAKAVPPASPMAAAWSKQTRRVWSHRHGAHRHASVAHERRDWRWDGGWSEARASDRNELMGGPALPPTAHYEDRFASAGGLEGRETSRSESWRSFGDEHREFRGAVRACPGPCGGPRRGFGYAGIDDRGYLVWPGKTEY